MAQRKTHAPRPAARLSRWQASALLCLFLAVRGLVPAGFMPAPVAAGTPYDLCHGDSRSALLLSALAQAERAHHGHGGHDHDALTAQSFADNHCSFSAGAGLAAAPALEALHLPRRERGVPAAAPGAASPRPAYLRPPQRAPPLSHSV